MTQHYLLTGCAGFIASQVARLLLDAGHQVTGVDNLNDAYDPRLKSWRLAQLAGRDRFRFVQADITDQAAMAALFAAGSTADRGALDPAARDPAARDPAALDRAALDPAAIDPWAAAGGESAGGPPFDAVLNLAARAGVRASVADPWLYVAVNTTGCLNLLDLCRRHGVKKFVLASTSSVYGDQAGIPYREDADASRPLSPYAASKKAAEALAFTYHRLHGLDVTVLRYFTVFGPAGRPDMAVFRFTRDIREGRPITMFGDGTQRRDFTYVEDIARGTVAALRPLGYEIINLGGDRPVPLSEVIDHIGRLLGRQPQIIRRPAHPADVPATWADITAAGRLLDWRPQTTLEAGLQQAVAWYEAHRDWAISLAQGD
jgi:UDP-glucuronate 4-epimerase